MKEFQLDNFDKPNVPETIIKSLNSNEDDFFNQVRTPTGSERR